MPYLIFALLRHIPDERICDVVKKVDVAIWHDRLGCVVVISDERPTLITYIFIWREHLDRLRLAVI